MHLHHKKTFFLLVLIILAFATFFAFLYYSGRHKLFIPATPVAGNTILPDSMAGPYAPLYGFENSCEIPCVTTTRYHTGTRSMVARGAPSHTAVIAQNSDQTNLSNNSWIAVSAWIYIEDDAEPDAQLVVSVTGKHRRELFSASIRISGNDVPVNKWFKISGRFDVRNIKPGDDHTLNVFLWNQHNEAIYMDDLLIVTGRTETSSLTDILKIHKNKL